MNINGPLYGLLPEMKSWTTPSISSTYFAYGATTQLTGLWASSFLGPSLRVQHHVISSKVTQQKNTLA
jgi:hypothetical protein